MADDIVARIREEAKNQTTLGQAFDLLRVADEIERLQQRGDNLAEMVREMPISHLHWLAWRTQIDNALMGWEEARRG